MLFEYITAAFDPTLFNGQSGDSFDGRSDNKGSEPEGVTLGVLDGRTYAFILLERIGGIMVYDVTTPSSPTFVQYVNTRYPPYEDQAPEGAKFISAADSPTGTPLLAVSFEFSGSVTLFEISDNPDGAGRLTLMHNNDGESQMFPVTNSISAGQDGFPNSSDVNLKVAGVGAYKTVLDRETADARQDGNAVLNVYAGDAFLASAALQCSLPIDADKPVYDAIAQKQMNYDAHAFGNHEFDFNPDFLKRFIEDHQINGVLQQPFVGANLDFSGEAGYANLIDADGVYEGYTIEGNVVAKSSVVIDEVTGQRFGLVAAITPELPTISTPRNVQVTSANIADAINAINTQVGVLQGKGINKIILVSHLQNLNTDINDVIPQTNGIDIAVGGGGDEILVNDSITATVPITSQLLPGEDLGDITNDYPVEVTDNGGRTVYLVTTAGNYKYAGRLDVVFDGSGEVSQIVDEKSYPRRIIPNTDDNQAAITALGVTDAVTPNEALQNGVLADVQACLDQFNNETVATTEVLLDVSRNGVRGQETNAGNLITDAYLYNFQKYAADNGIAGPDNRTIAIQNGGGIRQNAGDVLPVGGSVPGPITVLNTYDVLAFVSNKLTIVRNVSPADLKSIFERAAAGLPDAEGAFMQVSGLTVTYAVSQTAQVIQPDGTVTTPGQRVTELALADGTLIVQGGTVVGTDPVTITTNSFTAGGGDNYPWLANNNDKTDLRDSSGVLISYDQAWREFMSDPAPGLNGTVPAALYPVGGQGRIIINNP